MVWSHNRVKREIKRKKLFIGDENKSPIDISDLNFGRHETSLDLHLSSEVLILDSKTQTGENHTPIDITSPNHDHEKEVKKNFRVLDLDSHGQHHTLHKGELLVWKVREYISMPKNAFARVETKSKSAQLGISVHNSAPAIQRGWDGRIKLEITNTSSVPFILKPYKSKRDPGTVIAQLFFEEVAEDPLIYQWGDSISSFRKCKTS